MAFTDQDLNLSHDHTISLSKYLPAHTRETEMNNAAAGAPKITLTYATSLDSAISTAPKTTTALSGPETKAMTHYLRAHHDAILIGTNTAITDNPRLTSRWIDAHGKLDRQPRPIIMDPSGRWLIGLTGRENLLCLAREKVGRSPWAFVDAAAIIDPAAQTLFESFNGKCIFVPNLRRECGGIDWSSVLGELAIQGIRSLMVEGGAVVINDLLRKHNQKWLNSVIITIAPVFLGTGGIFISPEKKAGESEILRLKDTKYIQMEDDVVIAGFP